MSAPPPAIGAPSADSAPLVLKDACERVLVLTMSRSERLNALSRDLAAQLLDQLERAAADPGVGAVVLTGAGERAFGAGLDIREAATQTPAERDQQQELFLRLHGTLADYSLPTVAAINGLAAGASLQLALHCDLIVVGAGARLGMPELAARLPCIIGAWLMHRRLGPQLTADVVLSGRWLSAEEAVSHGLAARLVDAGEERTTAVAIAREIARRDPAALLATHRWLRTLRGGTAPESVTDALRAAEGILHESNRRPLGDPLGERACDRRGG